MGGGRAVLSPSSAGATTATPVNAAVLAQTVRSPSQQTHSAEWYGKEIINLRRENAPLKKGRWAAIGTAAAAIGLEILSVAKDIAATVESCIHINLGDIPIIGKPLLVLTGGAAIGAAAALSPQIRSNNRQVGALLDQAEQAGLGEAVERRLEDHEDVVREFKRNAKRSLTTGRGSKAKSYSLSGYRIAAAADAVIAIGSLITGGVLLREGSAPTPTAGGFFAVATAGILTFFLVIAPAAGVKRLRNPDADASLKATKNHVKYAAMASGFALVAAAVATAAAVWEPATRFFSTISDTVGGGTLALAGIVGLAGMAIARQASLKVREHGTALKRGALVAVSTIATGAIAMNDVVTATVLYAVGGVSAFIAYGLLIWHGVEGMIKKDEQKPASPQSTRGPNVLSQQSDIQGPNTLQPDQ